MVTHPSTIRAQRCSTLVIKWVRLCRTCLKSVPHETTQTGKAKEISTKKFAVLSFCEFLPWSTFDSWSRVGCLAPSRTSFAQEGDDAIEEEDDWTKLETDAGQTSFSSLDVRAEKKRRRDSHSGMPGFTIYISGLYQDFVTCVTSLLI
jgi:hypothetical protein